MQFHHVLLSVRACLLLSLAPLTLPAAAPQPAPATPPNILFIIAEDWSAFAVGAYGNPIVKTPHLDRLAAKGVRFDRAYCQGPVCNPSRASIVTSLRTDTTRIYGNEEAMDERIAPATPHLAQLLSQRPATLGCIGKLVHKWDDATRFADGFSFIEYTHEYDHIPGFTGRHLPIPAAPGGPLWSEDEAFYLPAPHGEKLRALKTERDARLAAGEPNTWALRKPFQQYHAEMLGDSGLTEEQSEDGRIARRTAEILAELAAQKHTQPARPFFLTVGLYATHTPLTVPKKFLDLYDPAQIPLTTATRDRDRDIPSVAIRNGENYDVFNGLYPEFAPTPERQRLAIASYYASATHLDTQIGHIIDALEKNHLAENTIIIFTSDHGFHLGEHGLWSKYSLFEQSTRVPLIVYDPRNPANARSSDEIIELIDLLPTFLDLWQLPAPATIQGRSFLPLLRDPAATGKTAAYSTIPIRGLGRMVRTKTHRYTEWRRDTSLPSANNPAPDIELYDLTNDPMEHHNLAADPAHATTLKSLRQLLHSAQ